MNKLNIIRGWLTTLIGLAVAIVTITLVLNKAFDFIWEGAAGLGVCAILIMAPETVEKKITEVINKIKD